VPETSSRCRSSPASTHPDEQVGGWYEKLREIPMMFNSAFIQSRTFVGGTTVLIADNRFGTFTPTTANTSRDLVTINLGSTAALPQSELTIPFLDYWSTILFLNGYGTDSGLGAGMINLITHSRVWHKLWYANPAIRDMIRIDNVAAASPLFKLGAGISSNPLGNYAPSLSEFQIRFQDLGNGTLEQVFHFLEQQSFASEVIVVENGSSAKTLEVAQGF
jgi:hypothetical protein